jgi:hypothetical protein
VLLSASRAQRGIRSLCPCLRPPLAGRVGRGISRPLAMTRNSMKLRVKLVAAGSLAMLSITAGLAQDVPGVEICTRESRMDRRTGCLQSNVEFLQQVVTKNALDAQQKLSAATREIAALKEQLAAANRDVATLKDALAAMDAKIGLLLKAAQPPRPDAKPK